MDRPTGVTVLSILSFIGAGFSLLASLLLFVGMSFLGSMAAGGAAEAEGSAAAAGAMGMLAGLGAILGIIPLIFGVLYVAVGIGLWKLQNWARIITLVLAVLGLAMMLLGLVGSLGEPFAMVVNLVLLAVYGLIVWYLLQPHVKEAFGAS